MGGGMKNRLRRKRKRKRRREKLGHKRSDGRIQAPKIYIINSLIGKQRNEY